MLNTKVIDPKEINQEELQAYKEMATWCYAKHLNPEAEQFYTFIVLHENQQPKGLCVIDLSLTDQLCEIKHYYVLPNVDKRKGLKQLIAHTTLLTKEQNLPFISIKYALIPENEILDECLDEEGWTESRPWMKQYLFESKLFNPKWMKKQIPVPEGFSIKTWKELTTEHKNSLDLTIRGGGIPVYLTPRYREEYRQDLNTLFLLKENRVVGWSVTHTLPDSPDTIQYTSLFIHPLYRFHGYSIRLLVDSIRLHIAAGVKYGLFTLSLKDSNKSWKRFIERHLKPNSQQITSIIRRDKVLKNEKF